MTRKMKDSGVEWIGVIPDGWSITKNKYLLSGMYSGGTPTASEERFYCESGVPFVSISDMSAGGFVCSTKKSLTKEGLDDKRLQILPIGTILYSIYATIGAVAELKVDATISQAMLALFLKNGYSKAFYKYSLEAMRDYIFFTANGNTQFNLNAEKVWNFIFPLPSLTEQKQISEFLDAKCASIEDVIAKTKESIEEYKKLKQAMITEAVTVGVRGKRPMKDSGVDWIGQIPKEWNVNKMKYLGRFICGYAFPSSVFKNYGVRVMKISNIQPMQIDWSDESFVDEHYFEELPNYVVKNGTLVFALTRPIISGGIKAALVNTDEKILLNQRNAMFIGNERISYKWQYYLMLNANFIQEFEINIDKTGQQPNISSYDIENIFIPLPPLDEQQEIADYLDSKCAAIDTLISKKQQFIDELTAYKKSLIYEYVTGKKEVPA